MYPSQCGEPWYHDFPWKEPKPVPGPDRPIVSPSGQGNPILAQDTEVFEGQLLGMVDHHKK